MTRLTGDQYLRIDSAAGLGIEHLYALIEELMDDAYAEGYQEGYIMSVCTRC